METKERTMVSTAPSFEDFLSAWQQHQQLRRSGAPIAELSTSRSNLDALRLNYRRHSHN